MKFDLYTGLRDEGSCSVTENTPLVSLDKYNSTAGSYIRKVMLGSIPKMLIIVSGASNLYKQVISHCTSRISLLLTLVLGFPRTRVITMICYS